MLYNDTVTLVNRVIAIDADGFESITESTTTVYADVEQASRSEFYESVKAGLKVTLAVTIRYAEYSGQDELQYNSKTYRVVRTYSKDKEHIQLNCEEVVR